MSGKTEALIDGDGTPIVDFEQACRRIRELEKGLEDSIDLLLKRDKQLEGYERRICQIEAELTQTRNKNGGSET